MRGSSHSIVRVHIKMTEHIIETNHIKLWYEDFGRPEDTAVLLIMGAQAQGIVWPDYFCEDLARQGFRVIRFDHRDVGQSTCFDFKKNPYSLNDMAQDILELLDAEKIQKAHLVGTSMGGVLAQILAVKHTEKFLSLTIINSSCDLSSLKPRAPEAIKNLPLDEFIENQVQGWKDIYGPLEFPEDHFRPIAERACRRAGNLLAQYNHRKAFQVSNFDDVKFRDGMNVPTLVIHGTHDPILPFDPHGNMVMQNIPYARLLMIGKMGHLPGPPFLECITREILVHIKTEATNISS